jgi:hypothetical protein
MLKNILLNTKPLHSMNFEVRLPAIFVADSFIISITLRVMHSSGQAELERLDITKKEPPDYVY